MIKVVYTVCSSTEEAKTIGKVLVEERLCACVNIIPGMESIYRWDGEVKEANETILIIKTVKGTFDLVSSRIKELHSYEVPCIFDLAPNHVEGDYFDWLKAQVDR